MKKLLWLILPIFCFGQETTTLYLSDPTPPPCPGYKLEREVRLWDCSRDKMLDASFYSYTPTGKATLEWNRSGLIDWSGIENEEIIVTEAPDPEVCYHLCSKVAWLCNSGSIRWSTDKDDGWECFSFKFADFYEEIDPSIASVTACDDFNTTIPAEICGDLSAKVGTVEMFEIVTLTKPGGDVVNSDQTPAILPFDPLLNDITFSGEPYIDGAIVTHYIYADALGEEILDTYTYRYDSREILNSDGVPLNICPLFYPFVLEGGQIINSEIELLNYITGLYPYLIWDANSCTFYQAIPNDLPPPPPITLIGCYGNNNCGTVEIVEISEAAALGAMWAYIIANDCANANFQLYIETGGISALIGPSSYGQTSYVIGSADCTNWSNACINNQISNPLSSNVIINFEDYGGITCLDNTPIAGQVTLNLPVPIPTPPVGQFYYFSNVCPNDPIIYTFDSCESPKRLAAAESCSSPITVRSEDNVMGTTHIDRLSCGDELVFENGLFTGIGSTKAMLGGDLSRDTKISQEGHSFAMGANMNNAVGGSSNVSFGNFHNVLGSFNFVVGEDNEVDNSLSFVAGTRNTTDGPISGVLAGSQNLITNTSVNNAIVGSSGVTISGNGTDNNNVVLGHNGFTVPLGSKNTTYVSNIDINDNVRMDKPGTETTGDILIRDPSTGLVFADVSGNYLGGGGVWQELSQSDNLLGNAISLTPLNSTNDRLVYPLSANLESSENRLIFINSTASIFAGEAASPFRHTVGTYGNANFGILNEFDFSVVGSSILSGDNNRNDSDYASIVTGRRNTLGVLSDNSCILYGTDNTINQRNTTSLVGGQQHQMIATQQRAGNVILGGNNHVMRSNLASTMLGGAFNNISTTSTSRPGQENGLFAGTSNSINSVPNCRRSVILGGSSNVMNRVNTTSFHLNNYILAGNANNVQSFGYSGIVGGRQNQVTGTSAQSSTVVGGEFNLVSSTQSGIFAGNSNNVQLSSYCGVFVGLNNRTLFSTGSAILGGRNNFLTGNYTAIAGGLSNQAGGDYSFVGGGSSNQANGDYSSVIAGQSSTTLGSRSVILGGQSHNITVGGQNSAVVGGFNNDATALNSAVIGGANYTMNRPNSVAVPDLIIHSVPSFADLPTAVAAGLPSGTVFKIPSGTAGASTLHIID